MTITWTTEAVGFVSRGEWIAIVESDENMKAKLLKEGWRRGASIAGLIIYCRRLPMTNAERRDTIWKVMQHHVPPPATVHERNMIINDAWMAIWGGNEDARIYP